MAAEKYNDVGRKLVFEETFRSGFPQPTQKDAMRVLNEIRSLHSKALGWVELSAKVEHTEGGYVAVRHHALYR